MEEVDKGCPMIRISRGKCTTEASTANKTRNLVFDCLCCEQIKILKDYLVRTQLACCGELAVAAVAAEVSLSVELSQLMTVVTRQTACKTDTGGLTTRTAALDTGIQCLPRHVALANTPPCFIEINSKRPLNGL